MSETTSRLAPMTRDEKTFFEDLGTRIGELRRSQGLTQVQLAEILGVSQQTIHSFEKGIRRVPTSALPTIARTLAVSLEELLGEVRKPTKRGPVPRLQRQIERLGQLPKRDQEAVLRTIDAFLDRAS